MGRDLSQVEIAGVLADNPPDGILGECFPGDHVGFADGPEHGARLDAGCSEPRIEQLLDPRGGPKQFDYKNDGIRL
jgi:hypothetical protein